MKLQRYQRSKLEFEKNVCRPGRPRAQGVKPGWLAEIFFELQLWPLISLQPLNQNQCLVPHLKDSFHICLEIKVQGFWMTFSVCSCCSKHPYFNRAYIVRGWVVFGVSVWHFDLISEWYSKNKKLLYSFIFCLIWLTQ